MVCMEARRRRRRAPLPFLILTQVPLFPIPNQQNSAPVPPSSPTFTRTVAPAGTQLWSRFSPPGGFSGESRLFLGTFRRIPSAAGSMPLIWRFYMQFDATDEAGDEAGDEHQKTPYSLWNWRGNTGFGFTVARRNSPPQSGDVRSVRDSLVGRPRESV